MGQVLKRRKEINAVISAYGRSENNQKLFDKALTARKEKKNDVSAKLLKQIVEADALDFVAWTELGNIYFSSEKYSDAETAYNRCISLKPDFEPALVNLGKLFLAQKKYDASIETFSRVLVRTPDSADVNHYLGESYLQAKKGSKAVIYLNKAIEIAPIEKAELHLRLASLYNAANVKDRAVAEYKLFLTKVPNHIERATLEQYIKANSPK